MRILIVSSCLLLLLVNYCDVIDANPVELTADYDKKEDDVQVMVVQVPFQDTVTISCRSNDNNNYFFHFWHLNEKNKIVGPVNPHYDLSKFRYEILSGNLTIKKVSFEESGVYNCFSRGVRHDNFNVRSIRLIIIDNQTWDNVYEDNSQLNLVRVLITITSLVILSGVAYTVYRIWRNRFRHPNYLVPSDEEDDDSADELFRAPGTSRGPPSIIRNNSNETFEPDVPGISTDFKSILDNVNSKK